MKNRLFIRKVLGSYILHKIENNVLTILGDSQHTIGGIDPFHKISHNNCEAIANGYDLYELAQKYADVNGDYDGYYGHMGFIKGFQTRNEMLDSKVFSLSDLRRVFTLGRESSSQDNVEGWITFVEFLDKLKTNEWDVEIEMMLQVRHGVEWHDLPNQKSGNDPEGIYQHVPKLDSDGCIILKPITK